MEGTYISGRTKCRVPLLFNIVVLQLSCQLVVNLRKSFVSLDVAQSAELVQIRDVHRHQQVYIVMLPVGD